MSPSLHRSLPNLPPESVPEISVYLNEAWGNRTRIDYGSGMELNFLCWLYVLIYHVLFSPFLIFLINRICLERLQVLGEGDHKAIVLKIVWR